MYDNDENLVTLQNVSFSYVEDQRIIKDISLVIPKGKIVAIMGGSGCGKTTLLKLITRQYTTDDGIITVLGQKINDLNNKQIMNLRKQMGMLFQFGALFTDMSVFDNVAFNLREHTNLDENIIKTIVVMKLKAVGLFGTQELFPYQLSGGMARRVALARSISLDPVFMMYDEPFTGLDPISLNITAMLIKKLNETLGQTSILVTHDISVSLRIADYVYFLSNGCLIAQGKPSDILISDKPEIKQFINGEITGPYNYEYQTDLDYDLFITACA